ncbi:AAA family ATPase [Pseudomonas sp. v388]|uniref:DNA repair ATPase n=1 Tax=Pseudomonas sp. v388 TaxID=2479849 RepID=UPI000F7B5197|nr:DNA repair ATPase [Pseudomonas sp. v388]RRV05988.1 AAA family ATPase [Pseudomonas sp. v388]
MSNDLPQAPAVDNAVAEGGAYEVLLKRLRNLGSRLSLNIDSLNEQRLAEFGGSRMEVLGRLRVRTENNCLSRDIVRVGEYLLFGYNVFLGLKVETRIAEVFGLFRLVEGDDGYDAQAVALEGSWLDDPAFRKDFEELYTYYRDARLLELAVHDNLLLASFQVGERIDDIRVFRWSLADGGARVRYIDNRGERDIASVAPYDFEWTSVTRDMIVSDRHPRVSILDSIYVQLDAGDLTLKIENNTAAGEVLYRHALFEKNQSLPDLQIAYARLGNLILLNIRPYKEESQHYLVYNTLLRTIVRIDAISQACQQLPEDHGIVFPGGLYLQNGEYRTFDASMQRMQFKRRIRSPNGEDVLYIFYDALEGRSALFTYNTISRQLQTPLFGHGYARLEDGRMVIFSAQDQPTRNHPMQIWQTPFNTDEHAARQPASNTFLGRIGNAELVRGISGLYALARETQASDLTAARFALLTPQVSSLLDTYHWLAHESTAQTAALLRDIGQTGESIADEFEKVEHVRRRSAQLLEQARSRHAALSDQLRRPVRDDIQAFVDQLNAITGLRGHLLTIREQRYIDVAAVDALEQSLNDPFERIAGDAAQFMEQPEALLPYSQRIEALSAQVQAAATAFDLVQPEAGLADMAASLDVLSGLANALGIDDATRRTRVIEAISQVYALLNQVTAQAKAHRKAMTASESMAEFAAQFQLFTQGITHALGLASTPQACDEQLSKLLIQVEDLESRFGEHQSFLDDIMLKREELVEAFEQHRQTLLDTLQRQMQALQDAANRILASLPRRMAGFTGAEQLNAFFAADPQVLKFRELALRLRDLGDSVKADDLDARLKALRDQAFRAQRDKTDLFDSSGKLLKLGPRHSFSINAQALDLTLVPRDDQLWLHITGTEFFERLTDDAVPAMRRCFQTGLESESDTLYRGEYLAWQVLEAGGELSQMDRNALERHIRNFCTPLYKEGYEKGVHDHDAALILEQLMPCMTAAGLLRFSPQARALALIAWYLPGAFETQMASWPRQVRSADAVRRLFNHDEAMTAMRNDIALALENYAASVKFPASSQTLCESADYLLSVLSQEHVAFEASGHAWTIVGELDRRLDAEGCGDSLSDVVRSMTGDLFGQWTVTGHWVAGLCLNLEQGTLAHYAPEAVALLLLRMAGKPALRIRPAVLTFQVDGLLGEHPTIREGTLPLTLDDFFTRLREHREVFVPQLHAYQAFRQSTLQRERQTLRIADFQSRPLASFVRNRLIDSVYLPLIADNLAKQIGAAGESKRSDLMGLLMLISPPGYGKTTLIEYIAFQLGMAFVKINGPALGHGVTSLDPAQAPDGPSRMELEKLNLALEMASNVCLLIDDIQHLSPGFLQKFISLCDGSRRIENVWKGQSKTCDLRGRKFWMVMAGNPYTESGEVFRIPDMLVNRADVYNLGEVTGGNSQAFALSYIENCMTSNPTLAPLANRDVRDLHQLVEYAEGRALSSTDLSHDYSRSEITELTETLRRLMTVRDILLKVNAAYIDSAAQADEYRTEPPFRLQGSYRNMNKLAERVCAVMNEAEIDQLVTDHYRGESQLLTHGAEENLLKLAELRGQLSAEQARRWAEIKKAFVRNKAMGGADQDVGNRIVAQLGDAVEGIRAIADAQGKVRSPAMQ